MERKTGTIDIADSGDVLVSGLSPWVSSLLDAKGSNTKLPTSIGRYESVLAQAVNYQGQVLCCSVKDGSNVYIWSPSKGFEKIRGISASMYSVSLGGMNDRGQITGTQVTGATATAFIWNASSGYEDLSRLNQTGRPVSCDINNHGEIVGWLNDKGIIAYKWSSTLGITALGRLGFERRTHALGINDHSQVVGTCAATGIIDIVRGATADLGKNFKITRPYVQPWMQNPAAFLWENSIMEDLNNLIDENSGWILTIACAINNSGQIAGVGKLNGSDRVFLLTPIEDKTETAH